MRSYAFWKDELWWTCCSLYGLNRWVIKPHTHNLFMRGHFNDVLLIPCALPIILQFQQWLGLRKLNTAPEFGEIFFHLAIWSVLFEVIGPHIMHVVGDPWDVVSYVVGGIAAGLWWHRKKWMQRTA